MTENEIGAIVVITINPCVENMHQQDAKLVIGLANAF